MKHACVSKGKTIKGDKKAFEKLGDCILHIWKLVLGSFSGAQETGKFNLEHGRNGLSCRWGAEFRAEDGAGDIRLSLILPSTQGPLQQRNSVTGG